MLVIWLTTVLCTAEVPANGAFALTRFGYGPRGSERAALETMSWKAVIEQQLAYELIDDAASDAAVRALDDLPSNAGELIARFPKPNMLQKGMERMGITREPPPDVDRPGELIQALQARRLVRAVTTRRQLYEATVELWLDHFNVFARKRGVMYAIADYERGVRKNALGSFDELLVGVAESAAIAMYLDNDDNVRPNAPWPMQAIPDAIDLRACKYLPQERIDKLTRRASKNRSPKGKEPKRQRGINENYARELLELHTLGVEGGYTQSDVTEVARVFTGWTVFDPEGALGCPDSGRAVFVPELHDPGDKVVLGRTITNGGRDEGLQVLRMLAHHPATARFIATKLVRRFVSDVPPPGLVDRVAAVFIKTNGDLRAVMRAVALDEATVAATLQRSKVKRPFDLVVSSLRAVDAETDGDVITRRYLRALNHMPYAWQTPNGYPDDAIRWINVGALTQRLRFGIALAGNGIPGTRIELRKIVGDEIGNGQKALDAPELIDAIASRLLGAALSKSTRDTAVAALADDPNSARAVGLLLGSPEFQHR